MRGSTQVHTEVLDMKNIVEYEIWIDKNLYSRTKDAILADKYYLHAIIANPEKHVTLLEVTKRLVKESQS